MFFMQILQEMHSKIFSTVIILVAKKISQYLTLNWCFVNFWPMPKINLCAAKI